MRLSHLDILEQCFHEKFRGYDRQEVDAFLHLVADEFKEMKDEITKLRRRLTESERRIRELEQNRNSGNAPGPQPSPEAVKEKTRQILESAREQARLQRQKTEEELNRLKRDIEKLTTDREILIENIKKSAKSYFQSLHKNGRSESSNAIVHQKD